LPLVRAELLRRRLPRPGPLIHDLSQVLYLPFDKDDGSYARDRSGHKNHGTICGAARVAGKVAGALSFDGVDDYGEVPHSESHNLDKNFTLGAWVYPKAFGPYHSFITRKYDAAHSQWRLTFGEVAYQWGITWWNGSTWRDYWGGHLPLNEWSHVALVVGDTWIKCYRNGSLSHEWSGITIDIVKTTNPLRIAYQWDNDVYINSIIDEVRVYNRALSPAEVIRLMNMRGI